MRALVLTDDPVLVNFVETLLKEVGIGVAVFDRHSNALRGALGEAPQRIMVADEQWARARELLIGADLGAWIVDEG